MTSKTTLEATLAEMTRKAVSYRRDGLMARECGYETEATECFLDAADLVQEAGVFAGTHGLDMPAILDGEHALADCFQNAAIPAYLEAHRDRVH
jgi:hypothetical protein